MNPALILLMASLAVWRLSELVAIDNGPFHLFKRGRAALKNKPKLQELASCPYCGSSWITIGATAWLAWRGLIEAADSPFWWAAIWGGAMGVMRIVRKRE